MIRKFLLFSPLHPSYYSLLYLLKNHSPHFAPFSSFWSSALRHVRQPLNVLMKLWRAELTDKPANKPVRAKHCAEDEIINLSRMVPIICEVTTCRQHFWGANNQLSLARTEMQPVVASLYINVTLSLPMSKLWWRSEAASPRRLCFQARYTLLIKTLILVLMQL